MIEWLKECKENDSLKAELADLQGRMEGSVADATDFDRCAACGSPVRDVEERK